MIINHNMNALTALNKLNSNNTLQGSAMEKLSSGLRINRASDDAAGLAISEKMRAQIRGLSQAQRNSQDGISLLQTAEAGLGSIQDPNLIRMRELCIQALNDTLTKEDRIHIQNELDQIVGCIDDIANNTEFNEIKVLRPPIEETPPIQEPVNGKVDLVFVLDDTGSMSSIQTVVKNNLENLINSIKGKGITEVRVGVVRYSDNKIEEFKFSDSKWTDSISDIENCMDNILSNPLNGSTENLMSALTDVASNYDFTENTGEAFSKHIIYVTNENADDADKNQESTIGLLKDKGIQVHGVFDKNFYEGVDDLNSIVDETGGKSIDIKNSNWGNELSDIIGNHIGESGSAGGDISEDDEMPKLKIQVGANSGQFIEIELFDARSFKNGIDDIKVDPSDEAEKSLEKIDNAINIISAQRSKFGAYQNRLEHTINNLYNAEENLQSSESKIRDTDMAKSIMEQSKYSILTQAAQAMLVQANQMPQSVLNLISSWK